MQLLAAWGDMEQRPATLQLEVSIQWNPSAILPASLSSQPHQFCPSFGTLGNREGRPGIVGDQGSATLATSGEETENVCGQGRSHVLHPQGLTESETCSRDSSSSPNLGALGCQSESKNETPKFLSKMVFEPSL